MQNACGLQSQITRANDLIQINAGAVAEQFIGQELSAHMDPFTEHELFFWARDKRGSAAEVDYVVTVDSMILPVEVKAGKTGTLRSLRSFMDEKHSPFGIRFSQEKLSLYDHVLTVPLYMVEHMQRLVSQVKSKLLTK